MISFVGRFASEAIQAFLGKPTEFAELGERLAQREEANTGGGPFGGLMDGFLDFLEAGIEANATPNPAEPPGMTAAADERQALFSGLRSNVSSLLRQNMTTA